MLCAIPIHSAKKLYVVQVRCSSGTGASSELKYRLSEIPEKSRSSTRPSGWLICFVDVIRLAEEGTDGSTAIGHIPVTLLKQRGRRALSIPESWDGGCAGGSVEVSTLVMISEHSVGCIPAGGLLVRWGSADVPSCSGAVPWSGWAHWARWASPPPPCGAGSAGPDR